MKKNILFILMSLVPTALMAQMAGEAIKRPTKKVQTAPAKKPANKPTPKSGMSKADKERILQNLINNMVLVEGGIFTMGATPEQGNDAYNWEKPAHQVTLSSFRISKYEVTQEEWVAVMGSNPSYFKGLNRPVEHVSWDDCQEFLRKLNEITGKHFRLPTEAEWEYAARGGNRTNGYKYAGGNNPGSVAWYWENSGDRPLSGEWDNDKIFTNNCCTHRVGQKSPNELGLYDMSGNVWEWCQDWYGSYSSSSQTNPTGPSSGYRRVIRGGCRSISARDCRSSLRNGCTPSRHSIDLGLRLALDVPHIVM